MIFSSLKNASIEYAVQSPDPQYKPFWDAAIAAWAVEHEQGHVDALVPWKDVKLEEPRPWWMPVWSMRVLRLEFGLPPDHPDDPKRRAMLGGCRFGKKGNRRAPTTAAEWAAIPESKSSPGDDEAGLSDAGSINDDVERGLPTSSHWDKVTKKSTTPRGKVRHPHMDVVEAQLSRNQEYDARVALEQTGPSASTAPPRTRGGQRRYNITSREGAAPDVGGTTGGAPERPGEDVGAGVTPMAVATVPPEQSPADMALPDAGPEDTPMADPPEQTPAETAPPGADPEDTPMEGETAPPEPTAANGPPPMVPGPSPTSEPPINGPPVVPSASRPITGTGPPRSFAPPPPNAPTLRSVHRSGPQPTHRNLEQARIREQERGYTVEPQ